VLGGWFVVALTHSAAAAAAATAAAAVAKADFQLAEERLVMQAHCLGNPFQFGRGSGSV